MDTGVRAATSRAGAAFTNVRRARSTRSCAGQNVRAPDHRGAPALNPDKHLTCTDCTPLHVRRLRHVTLNVRDKDPPIELFEMERMQSTWENLVDYDMSESGVRPLTLRELVEMGFDLEAFLDQPLGYSQSNGTIELRERDRGALSRRDRRSHRGHQRHVRSELPRRAEPAPAGRRRRDGGAELHADAGRRAQPRRRRCARSGCGRRPAGSPTGTSSSARSRRRRGCSTSRTRTTRPAPCCPTAAMRRIVERCEATGTWLLADEVYLGAEIDRPRTDELLGHERPRDRHERPVEGLRDSRRAHRLDRRPGRARRRVLDAARLPDDRPQQDVGSDRARRRRAANRERCYARTREILRHNLPIAREWVDGFGGRLTWREPQAGAIALIEVRRRRAEPARSPSASA